MKYEQAMDYISSTLRFGSILGLERMEKLMDELSWPCKNKKIIHVAGTNGKGSTSIMIANILAAAGYKVGLYTSPFINRFSERIRIINGKKDLERIFIDESVGEIPNDDFASYVTVIKDKVRIMQEEGFGHPTEFELVSAAAFMHYENQNCDFVVLETGLGGRLDSTNIFPTPLKCVITPIGYDHTEILGSMMCQIAFEKTEIIKKGAMVIASEPEDYATENDSKVIKYMIEEKCKTEGINNLSFVSNKNIETLSYTEKGQEFIYKTNGWEIKAFTPLLGLYQTSNASLAAYTCKDLATKEQIQHGIKMTRWPARMEIVRKSNPMVIIDGAHNPPGAKALSETLNKFLEDKAIVLLCGSMKDKDVKSILVNFFENNKCNIKAFFATKPNNERAMQAEDLSKFANEILDKSENRMYNEKVEFFHHEKPSIALQKAVLYARKHNCALIAFGSLYMAGALRDEMKLINEQID